MTDIIPVPRQLLEELREYADVWNDDDEIREALLDCLADVDDLLWADVGIKSEPEQLTNGLDRRISIAFFKWLKEEYRFPNGEATLTECSMARRGAEWMYDYLSDDRELFFKEVRAARLVWMEEFPAEEGCDCVTPFDVFLYGSPTT